MNHRPNLALEILGCVLFAVLAGLAIVLVMV